MSQRFVNFEMLRGSGDLALNFFFAGSLLEPRISISNDLT